MTQPTDIAGLKFWGTNAFTDTARTTAASADGDAVAAIADGSGNGYHVTQGTLANRPLHRTNGLAAGIFARQFDGSNDYLSNAALGGQLTGNFTLAAIIKGTDKTNDEFPISWGDYAPSKLRSLYIQSSTGYAAFSGYAANVVSTKDIKDGAAHYVVITGDGTTVRVRVDGAEVAAGTPSLSGFSASNFLIGCSPSFTPAETFKDFLRETIAYNSALSGANLTNLENYLSGIITPPAPSNVANLTVDANRNLDSSAATDNVAVTGYITQRRINGGAWVNLTPAVKAFQDNENLPATVGTHTLEYQRKAADAAGNQSAAWSNTASVTITIAAPPAAPIITSLSPLPSAQTGQSYSAQLQKTGGSGAGAWSQIIGNLPGGALSASGLITIPNVGSSNYTFTSRYTDSNGSYVEKAFTIPVSELATISFCHKRPLEIKPIISVSIFENLDGSEDVVEDAIMQGEFSMSSLYIGEINRVTLWDFLKAHRLRQPFYWHNPDRDETQLVKLVRLDSEYQMLNYGSFEFTIKTINGLL